MKITILGSWRNTEAADWGLRDAALFRAACRDLGAAVVRQGHVLIAAADDEDTADFTGDISPSTERRARENAWIEAGWVWGRLGRERLLLVRQDDTEIPSDLRGSDVPEYHESPREAGQTIRDFVASIRRNL